MICMALLMQGHIFIRNKLFFKIPLPLAYFVVK